MAGVSGLLLIGFLLATASATTTTTTTSGPSDSSDGALSSSAAGERRPLGGGGGGEWWAWRCVSGRCVREAAAAGVDSSGARPTLEMCRLTCGAYGALWPKPTGSVALGASLAPFHPRHVLAHVLCAPSAEATRYLQDVTALLSDTLSRECRVAPLQQQPTGGANGSTSSAGASAGAAPSPQSQSSSANGPSPLLLVQLCVSQGSTTLRPTTNESYVLSVRADGSSVTASVEAESVFGARHALETLSQLTACSQGDANAYDASAPMVVVAHARIHDAPAFQHRGVLLDTARHWLPERAIRRTIDAMAASKMNVLHWHATDSHSFPLQLPRVPQMARYGAYSASKTYSLGAVQRLVAFARLRGVRLLLELDAPAHSAEGWQWGEDAGLGRLALCVGRQPWREYCLQPPCGQLNPVNGNVYAVLKNIFRDLLSALPSGEQMHLGGDEVNINCWNSSAEVVQKLASRGRPRTLATFYSLWAEFHARQLRAFDEAVDEMWDPSSPSQQHQHQQPQQQPQVIIWSSHLTDPANLDKQYIDKRRFIIQTWVEGRNTLNEELLSRGFSIIVTAKDAWYLDHGFWGGTQYHKWREAYNVRMPHSSTEGRVLGGEVAMWGELVDEWTLDGRIWPRAAAAAERLWSDPPASAGGPNAAEARLLQQRQRLLRRGIRAADVTPEWCYQHEDECR